MKITLDLLKKNNACSEGREWFKQKFPDGAESSEVMAELGSEGKTDWAFWLAFEVDVVSNIADFVKSCFDYLWKICQDEASSGYESKLASSGYGSQLASSGYWSQLASSGHGSKLASSGDWSKLASSGDWSQLASSGDWSQLASSGDWSQLASSGDGSKLASSGHRSQLASSGDGSKLASSGHRSQLAITGKNSVGAAIGINSKIKGVLGTWITLAEWQPDDEGNWVPVCVKSAQIDGEILKPDVYYKLENGEFVEVI